MVVQENDGSLVSNNETRSSNSPINAFSQLMASRGRPKPKPGPRSGAYRGTAGTSFDNFQGREALGMYIDDPAAYMNIKSPGFATGGGADAAALTLAGQVISYSDDFVSIHDKYPKASVHCLLLPRDPAVYKEHPVVLLSRRDAKGAAFLKSVRAEAEKLRAVVAAELRRRFGQFSTADATREAILRGDMEISGGQLPAGRDWSKDVIVGVHARPSMSHVHVHVFSRDMHSDKMRHRKHYNSFSTPFLVRLDEFPLAPNDPRQPYAGRVQGGLLTMSEETANDTDDNASESADDSAVNGAQELGQGKQRHLNYLENDLICWRCGKTFGNRFQELKRHLQSEFEAWKRE